MKKMFPLGCAGLGIQASSFEHPVSLEEPSIMEKFDLLAESSVWDFIDHIPTHREMIDDYIKGSQKYNIPVYSGYGCYIWGEHEKIFKENIELSCAVGAKYHNIMLAAKDSKFNYLNDQQVADAYLYFYEYAQSKGITITFENHVDNWSEDYRRIEKVAALVNHQGIPFKMAMDYSHCIFKIENPIESYISFQHDQEAIRKLDPFNCDSFADDWLNQNLVHWGQIRPAVPNGPLNTWSQEYSPWEGHGLNRPGRGIQYPFRQPPKNACPHDEWHAYKLSCTQEVIRKMIDHYLDHEDTNIEIMTVDNINLWSYGLGWKYNMFADSCDIARYIRQIYAERASIHYAKKGLSSEDFINQYRS
ncbi:TIM barrel protein [Acinetobacter sp. DSM 11652]|uniref:TIM barrel protein n=1 Tax=Acinetobacter sp. DSM 11652 TaxID=346222 RepID=UPI0008C7793E|nr:TIM barrel protein [Acinetobacter sp. DSM 11652]SEL76455.1 Xylose isomerase-like TIM barrel [Acinetobacter sp. DSM 11652]